MKIFRFSNGYIVECVDTQIELDNNGIVVGGGILDEPRDGGGISIDEVPPHIASEVLRIMEPVAL